MELKVSQIVEFWKFPNFWNLTISEIWSFYEFVDDENLMIFGIVKFRKLKKKFFVNLENQNLILKIGKFWFCSSLRYSVLFVILLILIFALWKSKPYL